MLTAAFVIAVALVFVGAGIEVAKSVTAARWEREVRESLRREVMEAERAPFMLEATREVDAEFPVARHAEPPAKEVVYQRPPALASEAKWKEVAPAPGILRTIAGIIVPPAESTWTLDDKGWARLGPFSISISGNVFVGSEIAELTDRAAGKAHYASIRSAKGLAPFSDEDAMQMKARLQREVAMKWYEENK